MSEHDSLISKQLDEYQLEKMLGQGGMARVYRGIDTTLKRYVAIKVIDSQFRDNQEYEQRFEKEAQAIAQLDHPNVVSLYRYGNVGGLLYMAMQYIEGSDLRHLLDGYRQNGEFMTPDEALRILREAGRGFDYIHQQGIIHRDVKPSNIMLMPDGTVVITDFGLALVLTSGTHGKIFGTPRYMSPEQAISSAKTVPQSDIYSLGVILYEMLTNHLPFDTGLPLDIAMAHISKEPPPPRDVRPELSRAIEDVILMSLAKGIPDRYQTGKALADELETAIHRSQKFTRQSTMPRHSIIDRVNLDMAANPLPLLPEAATPLLPSTVRKPKGKQRKPEVDRKARTLDMPHAAKTVKAISPQTGTWKNTALSQSDTEKKGLSASMLYISAGAIVALLIIIALLLAISRNNKAGIDDRGLFDTATAETVFAGNTSTQQVLAIEQQNATISVQNMTVAAQNAAQQAAQISTAVAATLNSLPPAITLIPTLTPLPTDSPGITLAPTLTPLPIEPSSGQIATFTLFIYTDRNRAMRIVDASSHTIALPLEPLLIIRTDDDERRLDGRPRDNPRQLSASFWDTSVLNSGQCLDAFRREDDSPPEETLACSNGVFNAYLEGDANKTWEKDFRVYYDDVLIGECPDDDDAPCVITFESSVPG